MGSSKRASVFRFSFCVMLFALCASAEAEQATKIPRIGFLSSTSPSIISARVEAFRQGLRELGYVQGKNIVIEYRYAEGKPDRLPSLAAQLVHMKVDVIVSAGPTPTRPAKQATATIPIVMAFDDDPIGSGFAASLARPGGNITGLSTLAPEISGKQLELLREIVPKLSGVAVLGTATQPGNPQALREINVAADGFGVQLQYLEIQAPKDYRDCIPSRGEQGACAGSPRTIGHRPPFSAKTDCGPRDKKSAPNDI
jgi:ABC-type uncharacterized transport system substrate-binding protein